MVVLDACAIIAYLRNEDGADIVESALLSEQCFIHSINLCEVYKDCLSRGEETSVADQIIEDLESVGLLAREDMDIDLWKQVAQMKAEIRRISYADCFGLALTQRLHGTFYSSDHHELNPISDTYPIKFIR
jgi:PIN domain nuclease of toxin-antitoxin system